MTVFTLRLKQTQVFRSRYHTDRVGVALPTAPALHTNHQIILLQNAKIDGILDAPLEAAINILLPVCFIEVGLLLRVEEGVDTSVKVGILDIVSAPISSHQVLLTLEAVGLRVTIMMGQTGRYFETIRAD